jgi:hypothetical protein
MTGNRRKLMAACAAACVAVVMALAPGVALAGGSPNDTQYGNPSETEAVKVKSAVSPARTSPAGVKSGAARTGGTLPFTGQDIGAVVGIGALFILVGLGLRVAGRGRRAS